MHKFIHSEKWRVDFTNPGSILRNCDLNLVSNKYYEPKISWKKTLTPRPPPKKTNQQMNKNKQTKDPKKQNKKKEQKLEKTK